MDLSQSEEKIRKDNFKQILNMDFSISLFF